MLGVDGGTADERDLPAGRGQAVRSGDGGEGARPGGAGGDRPRPARADRPGQAAGVAALVARRYLAGAERPADGAAVTTDARVLALGRPEDVVPPGAGEQALEVYGTPEHLESVVRRAGEAGWRTRRSGPAVVIVRAEQLAGEAPDGVRRPANLEDAFVMLTGEQIE